MILISLRDLQFRRRRFAVAIAGTALVLGITLVLSGIAASFDNEAERTVDAFNSRAWVVPVGATGPFLASAALPAGLAAEVSASTGLPAIPAALLRGNVTVDGNPTQISVHGLPVGSFADPPLTSGRHVERAGEAVVDRKVGLDLGERFEINGRPFQVVGKTSGQTYVAGIPTVQVLLSEAQLLGYGGADLASTIVSAGDLATPPAGTAVLSPAEVRKDLVDPLESPVQTIKIMQWLLWTVATMIVGSVVYLSALDRVRDFAVFKAMGAADRSVISGLLAQSLLLCLVAYAIGVALSFVISPVMPMQSEVPTFAYYGLAAIAGVVAVLSSVAGARRALSVDPALAFGGA